MFFLFCYNEILRRKKGKNYEKQRKPPKFKSLDNSMRYDNADEVFEKLCKTYPENIKYIKENESAIKAYFEDILQENGEIIVSNSTEFWRCQK